MANDPVLNPGETLGDPVQQPQQARAAPQLNAGETLGDPVQEPGAVSRFGSGVVSGTKAMIPEVPSVKDTIIKGAFGPMADIVQMPKAAYEEYKQARSEGQPIISSAAGAVGAVAGLDPEGIRERAAKGDIAGIVGEAVPSILATVIGGEHERIGKAFQSDARALETAHATHESAKATYEQRLREQEIATEQAVNATKDAENTRQDFKNGNLTQSHVDEANNRASAAAANARKATQALNDAHTARGEAGAEVDRLARKIQRASTKVDQKNTKALAGAKEDYKTVFPPSAKNVATFDRDYDIGRGYLEKHHQNIQEVGSPQDVYDAYDYSVKKNESDIAPYVQRYAKEPIATNVRMDVRDALSDNPRADFVQKGMQELEKYNLTEPTIEEADVIRKQLNDENRAILKKNMWDVNTALGVDPEFAARYAAADSLRNGIYDTFEEKNVEGIREKRQDDAALIRLRDDAYRQITKGEARVRGSGKSGSIRKLAAKGSAYAGAATGAGIGAATGLPFGTESGAAIGGLAGKKLGELIAPGDLTRNELISRSMKVKGGGVPVVDITGVPATVSQFGPPQPVSPVMNMFVPQRELTPIHSELATHYGEDMNESSYLDLEKRLKEDLQTKKAHGVPLEPAEKTLLGKINLADATDRLKAQQQIQEREASGKKPSTPTLPDEVEPLLHPPQSKLAEGMDTRSGIVHDLAHVIIGDQRGLTFPDGIRSHMHPENVSAGALMSAPIDWSDFVDKDGNLDINKVKGSMADIAATYVAGGVANDLYHDIPFTENHHLGADVKTLKGLMKDTGFTEAEASKMIAQAAEDAAHTLSQPGVREMLEGHASVREVGLNEKYHVSPERVDQILDDIREVRDAGTTRKSSGASKPAKGASPEAGAGTKAGVKEGDTAVDGQEKQGFAEGKGGTVREAEPTTKPNAPELGKLVSEKGKPFDEQKYPYTQKVRVDWPEYGDSIEDSVKGLNKGHALARAKENWPGATITPIEEPEPKPVPEPKSPELSEPEDELISSEIQSPLKQKHLVQVIDREGNMKVEEVPAFSTKDAIKTAQKKYPEATSWGTEGTPKPIEQLSEYKVPTGKRLSIRGDRGEARDLQTMYHEHGHSMVGQKYGMEPLGMYRHTNPAVPKNATASMAWDASKLTNSAGVLHPDKLQAVLNSGMAGIAADEVFSGIPRDQNPNFLRDDIPYSDAGQVKRYLRNIGVTGEEAKAAMHRLIDQAKEYLTNPHVSDILKENVNTREPGLSRQYHYSPERLKSMHAEAQRRINETSGAVNDRAINGEGNQAGGGNVPGAEGGSPQATGPTPPESPKLSERLPKPTTRSLPPERTAGELDEPIKKGGAIPGGIQKGEPEINLPDYALFHDPITGSTLALPSDKVTPENVSRELRKSRDQYIAGEDRQKIAASTPEESKEQLTQHEQHGGSTFTPHGENLAGKDLYSVGSYPERTQQIDNLTPEQLAKFKQDNADVLSQPGHAVGTWKDPDTGKSVLDISKTYKDRGEAVAAGKQANQKAIYHLGGEGEITTGGTGEVIPSPKLSAYHPDLQQMADTYGTHDDPTKITNGASFIAPDGKYISLPAGLSHDAAVDRIQGYANKDIKDVRVPFINDTKAVRVRPTVDKAGTTLHVSVPKEGISPEQVGSLEKGIAKGLGYGNLMLETADNPKDIKTAYKDLATDTDVKPMLREIGALPESPKLGPKITAARNQQHAGVAALGETNGKSN